MRMLTVITAKKNKERTRIIVRSGPDLVDLVADTFTRLVNAGYMVRSTETCEPVVRTDEERHRATRILGELFGH